MCYGMESLSKKEMSNLQEQLRIGSLEETNYPTLGTSMMTNRALWDDAELKRREDVGYDGSKDFEYDCARLHMTPEQYKLSAQYQVGKAKYDRLNAHERAYVTNRDKTLKNTFTLIRKAEASDTRMIIMSRYTSKSVEESSWLGTREIPKQIPEKNDMDTLMDRATEVFGISKLSKSQKTKRGKKFTEKAAQQAQMINTLNQCNWQKQDAFFHILTPGMNTTSHEKAFLEKIGDEEDLKQITPVMRDLAFMREQEALTIEDESERDSFAKRGSLELEKMADKATRNEIYEKVLTELDKLDFGIFDYKSNKDFMNNEGPKNFSLRYARLKAFSHAEDMLEDLMEQSKNGTQISEQIRNRADSLHIKAVAIQQILADYENRAILIQSPYYPLLAGRDFDALPDDDLETRIHRTEDDNARIFMQAILDRRRNGGFAMGKSAMTLLKNAFREFEKVGGLAAAREQILAEADENAQPVEIAIDRDAFMAGEACYRLPYLVMADKTPEEVQAIKNRVLRLHRTLNTGYKHTYDDELHAFRTQQEKEVLWDKVDGSLYESIVNRQNRLEQIRARIKALDDQAAVAGYERALMIRRIKNDILTGGEYTELCKAFLKDVDEMSAKLKAFNGMEV